jgi:hypothetical protein
MTPEEIVRALKQSCSGCNYHENPSGCCVFEVLGQEAADLIESLTAENKRLKEERRWIPLTERIPTEQDADSRLCIEAYSKHLEQYIICRWYFVLDDKETTHWRKITQLPEESEESK